MDIYFLLLKEQPQIVLAIVAISVIIAYVIEYVLYMDEVEK